MLRGLTTTTFFADDVGAAAAWYAKLFGIDPYFVRPEEGPPAYIEFRIGDYQHEFGLLACHWAPHAATERPAGAVVYWAVDDLPAVHDTLLAMGATSHEAPTPREAGFVTASVVDPFGNILGIMTNPHYLEVLARRPERTV
ncbi:VOC family protein [Actinoalloteichus caeruleus]|uniref:VOC family protein n=1 Tax=Actinoalloteichus cyanogriseus TaxID=2893586 RepID=UPI003AAD35C0